jgi:hypothetical protein
MSSSKEGKISLGVLVYSTIPEMKTRIKRK